MDFAVGNRVRNLVELDTDQFNVVPIGSIGTVISKDDFGYTVEFVINGNHENAVAKEDELEPA
jgi:hypothetical protein